MNWYKRAQQKCSGCLMVPLDSELSKKIKNWGKKYIPSSSLHPKEGRETNNHITLLYGICTTNEDVVREIFEERKPIKAKLGKIGYFRSSDEFDVVIIKVESEDLKKKHKEVCDTLNVKKTFDEYKPHCTIAYVKKGEAAKYAGDTTFDGIELEFKKVIFSDKDKKKTEIRL